MVFEVFEGVVSSLGCVVWSLRVCGVVSEGPGCVVSEGPGGVHVQGSLPSRK